jgi:hypothetical protein
MQHLSCFVVVDGERAESGLMSANSNYHMRINRRRALHCQRQGDLHGKAHSITTIDEVFSGWR